ncbi:MAG: WecB/TagA/CpsF family glycosyltransferase [Myxococcales bacterium]|nr:WecB/TagA/CpsF family glycosyltransferase [Myxococcales bacterium]
MSESPERVPHRGDILGVGVSMTDYAEVVRCVLDAARAGRRLLLTAADVHVIIQARRDPAYAAALNTFDIVTPDGQPVRWGLGWTRQAHLDDRVYGPTLMLHVCEGAAREGVPIFLYGSKQETLDRLEVALTERFETLQVAGKRAGRFRPLTPEEQAHDAAEIAASGAAITFVGMGCPRQEWWVFHMRERLQMPLMAVGAAFDFHAGLVQQAPPWMQDRGLEWLFRLTREPGRLWRRYLVLNPQYLPQIAAQAAGLRRFPHHTDLSEATRRPCPG